MEQQLAAELDNSREIGKLIRLQEHRINNYESKIRKVEEGLEVVSIPLKRPSSGNRRACINLFEVETEKR